MKETVINLIAEMIKELQEKEGEDFETSNVYNKLMANKEISKIVDQFLSNFLESSDDAPFSSELVFQGSDKSQPPELFRVLSQEERNRFTPEAHGFLIRLFKLRLIDIELQEDVIERCIEVAPHLVNLTLLKGIAFYTLSMRMPELFFSGMSRYFENDEIRYH